MLLCKKYKCSVYNNISLRYSGVGCKTGALDKDYFPYGTKHNGQVYSWPIYRNIYGFWTAQGIDSCSIYVPDKIIKDLVKSKLYKITINKNKYQLVDMYNKFALIDKIFWQGECNCCGKCCMHNVRCIFLKEE